MARDHSAYWPAVAAGLVAVAVLAAWLTERIRAFAVRAGIQDLPNQRSSHVVPTPRGGGLAIVAVCTAGLLALGLQGEWTRLHSALLSGGAALAIIGWLDDVRGVPAPIRLGIHAAAAVGAVALLGELRLGLGNLLELHGWLAIAFAIGWIVWMINSYNFMDGIDGIAAGQCITVAGSTAVIALVHDEPQLAALAALMAAASLGFLTRNWQPARIFMGDVASGWIGFQFAVLALAGELDGGVPFVSSLILMGVFLVDSTWTLVCRVVRGEKPHHAHRDHAYQHATQRGFRHSTVSAAVMVINLCWLTPLAVIAAREPTWAPALLALAWAPLLALAIRFEAGRSSG